MRAPYSTALFTALATLAAASPVEDVFARAVCNRDNCLRAVVASSAQPSPSSASADCRSFMTTVVTPCPSTITVTAPTVTSTISVSSTATITTSAVVTTSTTTTSTFLTTTTVAAPVDKRALQADIKDAAKRGVNPFDSGGGATLAKRIVVVNACTPTTSKPSSVPTYASACSGAARYSSACSCDGITAGTTTLVASTSTVTTTPTVSVTTTLAFSTTSTSLTTTTATATTTVTSISLATASPQPTFYLKANYPASDASNANIFGYANALNGNANFIDFTPNLASAIQFTLDPATSALMPLNGPAVGELSYYSTGVGASSFILITTSNYAASQGGTVLPCSIDYTTTQLTCGPPNFDAFWLCGGHLNVVQPGYDFTNTCNSGTAEHITVSVVPIN